MKRRHKENSDQQKSLSDFGFKGQSVTKTSRPTDQPGSRPTSSEAEKKRKLQHLPRRRQAKRTMLSQVVCHLSVLI